MPLPSILTKELLSSIKATPHLPPNSWYFISATTLSTLNLPHEIPKVFKYAMEQSPKATHAEQLSIARRTREALVKSAAIIGLPKTINALFALKEGTPESLRDEPLGYSQTGRTIDLYTTQTSTILQRGQKFFDQVYGKVTNRVMGQMDRSGTEDLGLLARIEYGYILSPTGVLNAAETSYVVLAALVPQDVNPQLKGHLVGAVNNGATRDEVNAVRGLVVKLCEAAGMRRLKEGEMTPEGEGRINLWGWKEDVAALKPPKKDSKL
jgi:alkylhydroperoxidase/carboxymuconolactone decarboxylase family protein YurZ